MGWNNLGGASEPLDVVPGAVASPVSATAIGAAAAGNGITIAAVAGKTAYLTGYLLTALPAAAIVSGRGSIGGVIGGPLFFDFVETTAGNFTPVTFPVPLAAAAPNTAITLNIPAIVGGAETCVIATGYYL